MLFLEDTYSIAFISIVVQCHGHDYMERQSKLRN